MTRQFVGVVLVAILGLCACTGDAPEPLPTPHIGEFTRGPVPESARLADGSIDLSQVPDFIPAAGETDTVGWIWSADVLLRPGRQPSRSSPSTPMTSSRRSAACIPKWASSRLAPRTRCCLILTGTAS